MNYKIFVLSIIVLSFILSSCNDKTTNPDTNKSEVTIGTQVWMAKNLDITTYRDGSTIRYAGTVADWKDAGSKGEGAWCYYGNDANNSKTYGKLYNWYAVNSELGLAPSGWHVPSDEEWTTLSTYLGGVSVAGGKLKSTGTIEAGDGLWKSPNKYATNESGFSALPGGYRYFYGEFYGIGVCGYWLSSTEFDTSAAYGRCLIYGGLERSDYGKAYGFSVRCVKD